MGCRALLSYHALHQAVRRQGGTVGDRTQARESDLQHFYTAGETFHNEIATLFSQVEQVTAQASGATGHLPPGRWIDPFRATVAYAKYNNDWVQTLHQTLMENNVGIPTIGEHGGIYSVPDHVLAAAFERNGLNLAADASLEDLLLTVLDDDQIADYRMLVEAGIPPLQAEMLVSRSDQLALDFRNGVRLDLLNAQIENWTGTGNEAAFDALVRERNELILTYTGADSVAGYDPSITAVAMQNGITYEQADFAVTTATIDQLNIEIDNYGGHPDDDVFQAMLSERSEAIDHLAEGDGDLAAAIRFHLDDGVSAAEVLVPAVQDVYGDRNLSEILAVLDGRMPEDGAEPVFDPMAMALQTTLINEAEEFTGVGFDELNLGIAVIAQDEGETYNSIVAMMRMDQQSEDPQIDWPDETELPGYIDVDVQSGREAAFILLADETGVFRELETADDGGMENYDGLMGRSAWEAVLENPSGFSDQAVDIAEFFRDNPDEWAMFDTAQDQGAALATLAEGEYYVGDGDNKTSFADVGQYITNTDLYNTLSTAVDGDNALLVDIDGDGVFDEDEFEAALESVELALNSSDTSNSVYMGELGDALRFAIDSDMLDQPDNRAWYEKVGSGMYRIGSLVPMSPTNIYRTLTEPDELLGDYWSLTKGAGEAVWGIGVMAYDLSAMDPNGPTHYLEKWRVGGDMERHRGVQMAQALPQMGSAALSLVPGTPQFNEAREAVRRSGTWDSHPGTNLLLTVVDVEGFVDDPARWFGQFVPDLIVTAFTGGGGAVTRIGSTGSRLSNATRRLLLNVSNNGLRNTTTAALRRAGTRLTTLPMRMRYDLTMRRWLPDDGRVWFTDPLDRVTLNLRYGDDVNPDGMLDVVGHGNSNAMQIDFPGGPRTVTPAEMAAMIRAQPQFNGQPIRLISCETGCDQTGFARQLADELGVPVYAPDQLAWAYPDGTVRVASVDHSLTNPLFPDQVSPTYPSDGDFRWFTPDGVDPPSNTPGDGQPATGHSGVDPGASLVADGAVPINASDRLGSNGMEGWSLPEGGGGTTINGRWYTEHALERIAPNTPEVRAVLESRALERAAREGLVTGTPEFAEWWAKNGPAPRNVPPMVVEAEILNPGSTGVRVITNDNGDVVTVIPR